MKVSELTKYKDNLYASLSRELSDFEKNFLFISSGVFAFSVTFIKEIVKIEYAGCLILLIISWVLFAIAIGLMMLTYLCSANASDELWKFVDDYLVKKKKFSPDEDLEPNDVYSIKSSINSIHSKAKNKLKIMRYSAVGAFISGLLTLSIFVFINLSAEIDSKHQKLPEINNKQIQLYLNKSKIILNDTLINKK